jgi:hypothetical protein
MRLMNHFLHTTLSLNCLTCQHEMKGCECRLQVDGMRVSKD